MVSLSPQEKNLAEALLEARTAGKLVDPQSVPVPADMASAMRVQAWVSRQLGEKIIGWKVGFSPENVAFAAPLSDSAVLKAPACWLQKPGPDFRIEIEIGIRLAKDLPVRPDRPYSREELADAIDTVFCGIEMLASRYSDPSELTFLQGLADNSHNGGYILGEEKKTMTIPGPLDRMTCRATLDGMELFNAAPKHPQNDILLPVIAYASAQNDGLGGLKAGQIITTGSLSGVISSPKGGKFIASLTGFDEMIVDLAHT